MKGVRVRGVDISTTASACLTLNPSHAYVLSRWGSILHPELRQVLAALPLAMLQDFSRHFVWLQKVFKRQVEGVSEGTEGSACVREL